MHCARAAAAEIVRPFSPLPVQTIDASRSPFRGDFYSAICAPSTDLIAYPFIDAEDEYIIIDSVMRVLAADSNREMKIEKRLGGAAASREFVSEVNADNVAHQTQNEFREEEVN